MIRILTLLAMLIPGVAHALSCSPPNAAGDVHHSLTDPNLMVVVGELVPPDVVQKRSGEETLWTEAEFTGVQLSGLGEQAVAKPISIAATCIGIWCAELPVTPFSGLFVLSSFDGRREPVLHLNACAWGVYEEPDRKQREILIRCLRERGCLESDFAYFSKY